MKNAATKKTHPIEDPEGMRAEYDFSGGVRGKYADRYREGSNVVLLDPEVAAAFPDSASVNQALRAPIAIAKRTERGSRK